MKLINKFAALLIMMYLMNSLAFAQPTTYRARLSEVPVSPQTYRDITGVGEVFTTLNGATLTVSGNFEGMSSAATAAHVHSAPPAMNGPPIGALEPETSASGEVTGELELTAEQVEALRNNELYIVIHSENNPGGELRGWLFFRES